MWGLKWIDSDQYTKFNAGIFFPLGSTSLANHGGYLGFCFWFPTY
jgi:hypothetical protein